MSMKMKESHFNMYMKNLEIGLNYRVPLCSSKHHNKKRNLKVDLSANVQYENNLPLDVVCGFSVVFVL